MNITETTLCKEITNILNNLSIHLFHIWMIPNLKRVLNKIIIICRFEIFCTLFYSIVTCRYWFKGKLK